MSFHELWVRLKLEYALAVEEGNFVKADALRKRLNFLQNNLTPENGVNSYTYNIKNGVSR